MNKLQTLAMIIISIMICVVITGIPHAGAAAKAKPVEGLMEMFETFNELEEQFRENKWDEALEVVTKIEKEYKGMVNELKGKADSQLIHKFGFVIGNFKKTLAKKDPEAVEKPFMMLQDLFLDIMDAFDYPHPPVLKVLGRWVDESKEHLESDHYKGIADEMEEIEELKERSFKAVSNSPELLKDFFEHAERAQQLAAGGKKDKEKLEEILTSMDSILLKLMK